MHKAIPPIAEVVLVVTLSIVVLLASPGGAQTLQEPSNKVVIIVDGSGSYKARQMEAVNRAAGMLEEMSQTKLLRWESGTDHISIIALDAMPEVLWSGSLQELKAVEPKAWTARFLARKDLASCTDVSRAFQLAARDLAGDPRYVSKYLMVFSDLIHEPPTSSVRSCQKARFAPPEDLPWEQLSDVSVTAFWVPSEQKFLWRQTTEKLGMSSTFALYTDAESPAVKITPPPRPTIKTTEEDRTRERTWIKELGMKALSWVGMGLGAIILLPALILLISRLARGRAPRIAHPAPRPVRPLPLGGRRPGNPPHPGGPRPLRPVPQVPPHNQHQR